MEEQTDKPFRVLTIDGGGMRGIYSAAFLSGLVTNFERGRKGKLDIGKGFDLIVGTSTGAILATAAAIGKPMDDVVQMYREYGPQIFPLRLTANASSLPQFFTRPAALEKGEEALISALKSVLGVKTLGQVYAERGIALAIPAVEMGQQRAWVFKTPHLPEHHRDDNFPLVDVCLASSAAPVFRSLAVIKNKADNLGGELVFADGGLWANNPSIIGLVDALQMASPGRAIEIFSLGTCPRPEGAVIKSSERHRGLFGWQFGGKAVQLSLSAQEYANDNIVRMLAGSFTDAGRKVSFMRFPNGHVPPDTLQFLDIDDTREEAMNRLIDQARADVNITKSACDDKKDEVGRRVARLFEEMPLRA